MSEGLFKALSGFCTWWKPCRKPLLPQVLGQKLWFSLILWTKQDKGLQLGCKEIGQKKKKNISRKRGKKPSQHFFIKTHQDFFSHARTRFDPETDPDAPAGWPVWHAHIRGLLMQMICCHVENGGGRAGGIWCSHPLDEYLKMYCLGSSSSSSDSPFDLRIKISTFLLKKWREFPSYKSKLVLIELIWLYLIWLFYAVHKLHESTEMGIKLSPRLGAQEIGAFTSTTSTYYGIY